MGAAVKVCLHLVKSEFTVCGESFAEIHRTNNLLDGRLMSFFARLRFESSIPEVW